MMAQGLQSWVVLSSFLLISLLMMISKSTAVSDPLSYECLNTTMFANNSQYQTNLNTIFRSLRSNATNPFGYSQAVAGNGPNNALYGYFLCRGDMNASTCQDCVDKATTLDLPQNRCPNRIVAIIWYEECMVRYSNVSFFGIMSQQPMFRLISSQNITGNAKLFMDRVGDMMNGVAVQASNGGPQKKFGTAVSRYSSLQTLYGLGQCTPDLDASTCNQCLKLAIGLLATSAGARVVNPTCNVRYEIYPFIEGVGNDTLPQPPTPSTSLPGVTSFTILNNCNQVVWPAISIGSGVDLPREFSLSKGKSKIINNIPSGWLGQIWGRTFCSLNNETHNFSCQTGNYCNGNECQLNTIEGPVTVAKFTIGQFDNQDNYSISLQSGYNLPMMVEPRNGFGAMCVTTGCMFELDPKCPPKSRVGGNSLIACENPCYKSHEICQNRQLERQSYLLCEANENYCDSSNIFEESCPRAADIANSNKGNTTFTCERKDNYTFYDITFCPPSDKIGQFSRPYEPNQESLPAPPPSGTGKPSKTKIYIAIGVPTAVLVLLISSCMYHFRKKAKKYFSLDIKYALEDFTTADSLMFELETLQSATNYFSDDQKLGGGGFGNVYKGTLPNGQEIAVKRLTRFSDHGLEAFKNEVVLIAKLQHKNLVRLLGFCSTREERLLVYEFLPNKSLDYLLFDPRKQGELDWPTRYNIVVGIARGLLYLHEDSRPRIIHRDLKAPNILLEKDMNPKISDFGLARISKIEQAEAAATSIIAGTYGYMAPEYAMHGQYSIKSDAYSFGVLLLEIVSGKKIHSKFPVFGDGDLLTYAWRSWKDGNALEFLDPTLKVSCSTDEVLRCIHLGLLCVQENSHERPTMSTIVFMLNTNSNTSTLPKPQCPRSFYRSNTDSSQATTSYQHSSTTNTSSLDPTPYYSRNQLTMSEMSPR